MNKKSKTRLFINNKLSLNLMVKIKDKQHHFLKNVMRIKINDKIILLDNQTGEWFSTVISINRNNCILKVEKKIRELKNDSDIWLAFSPIKLHRLNITIQKATELGVSEFFPCSTKFTNEKFLNYKNLNLSIIEAAEQCERLNLPFLNELITIENFIKNHPKDRMLIFCDESYKSNKSMFSSLIKIKKKFTKWTLLIGPEGGFSEKESSLINSLANVLPISLGKRILRSDTATTAALFCLQSFIENK